MDRSFLSQQDVVDASRAFVCVRPATYMDAEEAQALTELVRTPSGKLENTAFTILAPDGETKLVRGSRSPSMTFRTRERMVKRETTNKARVESRSSISSIPLFSIPGGLMAERPPSSARRAELWCAEMPSRVVD